MRALGTLALAPLFTAAAGAALGSTPVGSEFQVNTYTTLIQRSASVAVDADGDFVVVWQSYGSAGGDTLGDSIQGQRYDSSGAAVGPEFQINTYTTSDQWLPSVAIDADGDFVVVWESRASAGSDPLGRSIQGQRFDANGVAVGPEFQVNTYTTSYQLTPSVAVDADGDFVVVWESKGSSGGDTSDSSIQGQRFDASGLAVGPEFQVNSYTTDFQRFPVVAVDADGDFVVVWESKGSSGSDTSDSSIQGQRFDASGGAVGPEFQVNTYTSSGQLWPAVAVDADGDFVVVWWSDGSAGSDTSSYSIQGQRYDSSGNSAGPEFQVNSYTTGYQFVPSVAADADGNFMVVWESRGSSGNDNSGSSIQGQRYASSGHTVGSEFQVNTYTSSQQIHPSVGVDADGDFVVVWRSNGSSGSDISGASIHGQRYHAPMVPALWPPGLVGLAVLLVGAGAARLRGGRLSRS